MKKNVVVLFVLLCFLAEGSAQILAFPTAEGFGKYASGGRGGKVVEVTNLNDALQPDDRPESNLYSVSSLYHDLGISGTKVILFIESAKIIIYHL